MNRLLCFALGLVLLAAAPHGAAAQATDFPSRPVRIVVAFPPGGPNDLIARAVGQRLSEIWKQPVVIDNRPGASGIVGSEHVARAAADGYTLMLASITHSILPSLYAKLPFDPVEDFTPVSLVGLAPLLFVVHPSVPATSVAEVVTLAKSRPGQLAYGSTGNGTSIHLVSEMFKRMAGVDIIHVPYKGSAPAMNDLLGGQVQMMIEAMPSALPHVQAGKLRALAVTSAKRSADVPDLPTVAEAGLPGFEAAIWWGLVGPARLPGDLVERLAADVKRALEAPEVRQRFAGLGVEPVGTPPAELGRVIRTDVARFAKVVQEAGIRID